MVNTHLVLMTIARILSKLSMKLMLTTYINLYDVLIRCPYTMSLYDVLIRCPYTMFLYDVLIRCPYTP